MAGFTFLQVLSNSCDIIFVQEHWLAPFDTKMLDEALPGYICYASSAMGDAMSNKVGLMVGWPSLFT